jgi:hypothetical protein
MDEKFKKLLQPLEKPKIQSKEHLFAILEADYKRMKSEEKK